MAEIQSPGYMPPDLSAIMAALGQMLVPEYLKQRTGPYDTPTVPGKMPAVENDPAATAAFGGLDLIGNLAPMGGAKLAGPAIAAAVAKAGLPRLEAKGLTQTGHTPAEIEAILQSIEKQLVSPPPVYKPPAIPAGTEWMMEKLQKAGLAPKAPAEITPLSSLTKEELISMGLVSPPESIAPATNWAEETPAAFKKAIKGVVPDPFEQMPWTGPPVGMTGLGPTAGAKPTLAKSASDFPNPNIPPLPKEPPVAPGWEEMKAKIMAGKNYTFDKSLNEWDIAQAKLLMPKDPVPEEIRQIQMAMSPYQTPTFHGTHSPFEGNTVYSQEFFSAPNPKLAEMYAGDTPTFDNYKPQMLPLRLDTSKYHSYDAEGQTWDQVNQTAVRQAREKGAPGVEIRNVLDEPSSGSHSEYKEKLPPQTVYITLNPSTVRSDKAQFDPDKYHLNDLLAALGLGLLAPGVMGGKDASK